MPPARNLIVVSAPSGGGKAAILERVMARDDGLALAVSATTRPPRSREQDGVHYYFMTPEAFDGMVQQGAFVEWAEVHGNRYGTLRTELERILADGKDAVLELDVQGMRQVRQSGMAPLATIFIEPPNLETLRQRLLRRGEDAPEQINRRLENAKGEMAAAREYDYVIVNDALGDAVDEFRRVLAAIRQRSEGQALPPLEKGSDTA